MKANSFQVGSRYNRWTVLDSVHQIQRFGNSNRPARCFKCKCDCGTEKWVRGDYLINGRSKSCGCLRSEQAKRKGKIQKTKTSYHNLIYGNCKRSAKHRGITFNLTKDEHYNIITKACTYCGQLPMVNTNANVGIPFPHLGVDRIDSKKGYETFNCVSCCSTCNKMKLDLSLDNFTDHIMKIATHLNLNNFNQEV
jgi:hypothetical protein